MANRLWWAACVLVGVIVLVELAAVALWLINHSSGGRGAQQREASLGATHETTSVELRGDQPCPEGSDDAGNRRQQAPHGDITFLSNLDGDYDIYVMNENGGELRNLTNTSANELGAVWSADDEKMAIVTYRRQGDSLAAGLYVMNPDGTGKHAYHEEFGTEDIDTLVSSLVFSPDGKKLAFAAKGYYHVMYTDGTVQARLGRYPKEPRDLLWSPDSEKITFEEGLLGTPGDIFVVNADGSGLKNLTNSSNDEYFDRTSANGGYEVWSPDSKRITFFRETGTVGSGRSEKTVGKELVVKADGTGEPVERTDSCPWPTIPGATDSDFAGRFAGRFVGSEITSLYEGNEFPTDSRVVLAGSSPWRPSIVSPDGMLSLEIVGRSDSQGDLDIVLLEICLPGVRTSSCWTNLTNTQAVDEYDAIWSPDGKKIAFTSDYGSNRDIHVMNIDGTGRTNITNNAAQDGPVLRWD